MASKQAVTIDKPAFVDTVQRIRTSSKKFLLNALTTLSTIGKSVSVEMKRVHLNRFISTRVVFVFMIGLVWALSIFLAHKYPTTPTGKSLGAQTSKIPSWCDACRATKLAIPSILLTDDHIAQMTFDTNQKTWPTPITGIATPLETVTNNVIVFGHSKWSGKVSNFARVSLLKIGDIIYITDQYDKVYPFKVESLSLVDRFDGSAIHAKDNLQLTLLTSARQNGEWLLPSKVSTDTQDLVKDTSKYAIFVVTAKLSRD